MYIILIDDDIATNVYHEIILKKSKLFDDYKLFDSAEKALLELGQSEKIPDLILLDINMPKMDGWEFLKEYSKCEHTQLTQSVIMLTTSLSSFDASLGEENPLVKDMVEKPLTVDLLNSIIEKHKA